MITPRWFLLRMRNVVGKIKTHILCSVTFFLKSCRLWNNVEKYDRARQARDDNKTGRMRFACWITKATHTHTHTHTRSEYSTIFARPRQRGFGNVWILHLYVDRLSAWMLGMCSHKFTPAHAAISRIWQHLAYGQDWQRCHVMIPMLQNNTSLPVRHCSTVKRFVPKGHCSWFR